MSVGFIVILLFTLQGFISRLGAVNRDTTKQLVYRSALNSLLSYTEAGIKRRWCFTEVWTPDDPENCNLAHARSSERLLLSASQIDFIRDMIILNPGMAHGDPVALTEFQQTVDLKTLTADHPLRQIIGGPDFSFLSQIRFTISRLSDPDLPVLGSEAHVRIQVEMIPGSGQSFPQGRSQMKAYAKVTYFPREMGTFALVVPGNLYLDGQGGSANGDVVFPSGAADGGAGVVFESPIFVNGHVNIPPNATKTYTNVTFMESLIIGGGVVKQNGKPAVPTSAGSFQGHLASSMPGFGGFQQGISIDGERDLGLDVFSGSSSGTTPVDTQMKTCISRNRVKTDFMATAGSSLLVRSNGEDTFGLSWSKDNFFSPQDVGTDLKSTGKFHSDPLVTGTSKNGRPKSVANVKMQFEGVSSSFTPTAEFNLSAQGNAKIFPTLMDTAANYKKQMQKETPGSTSYLEAKEIYEKALQVEKNPGGVEVQMKPVEFNGSVQPNQLELQLKLINPENLYGDFKLTMNGYDMSYVHGEGKRNGQSAIDFNPTLKLNWTRQSGRAFSAAPTLAESISTAYARADRKTETAANLAVLLDWNKTETDCNPGTTGNNLAFQPSSWDYSFASGTRHSWDINPYAGTLVLNSANASSGAAVFQISSIADQCLIQASADFVTGFFVCDRLTIEARSTPLRIVGTFIVNRLSIDPSVYRAGLRWSNIYSPNSAMDLRAAKVLKPKWSSCDPSLAEPVWHPFPTVTLQDDMYNCNSISLRAKADPFTWTTMDPDCGLKAGSTSTTCKRRPVRFSAKEFDRGFEL